MLDGDIPLYESLAIIQYPSFFPTLLSPQYPTISPPPLPPPPLLLSLYDSVDTSKKRTLSPVFSQLITKG